MTLAGFLCLLRGGGGYRIVASDRVPTPTDEEWATDPRSQDGRPKPTAYYRRYDALCSRCGRDIWTHLSMAPEEK
jgi:hypothetical protein